MTKEKFEKVLSSTTNQSPLYDRRSFLKMVAIAGSSIAFFSWEGCDTPEKEIQFIAADYNKCIGCRTCETVCSAYNEKEMVNGEWVNGLGNPYYSRIRVNRYSPDVDVPNVCVNCFNPPCVRECTSPTDPVTGNKALYRDEKTLAIKLNPDLCEPCDSCFDACKHIASGILIPHSETSQPIRICNLCDGDPQCVKYCPGETLTLTKISVGSTDEFYGKSPEVIAAELAKKWYHFET